MKKCYRLHVILLFLSILFIKGCGPKAKLWKGKYVNLKTTELPKEDFKVGSYIVVSYAPIEQDENSSEMYKFAVIKEGAQSNLLVLVYDMEKAKRFGLRRNYLLMEEGDISIKDTFDIRTNERITRAYQERNVYIAFDKLPSYEELKKHVIELLREYKLQKIEIY
ncbi:hypothetical protein KAW18_05430 [candidate division WOR-3 bacterium]|nr:hypothetical protein [candidate division WOR-3 bacterium]